MPRLFAIHRRFLDACASIYAAASARDREELTRVIPQCMFIRFAGVDDAGEARRFHRRLFPGSASGELAGAIFQSMAPYSFSLVAYANAIGPGMIAGVHERLLDASSGDQRRRVGAFYTDDAEIDLMCRLALVDYFSNHFPFCHKPLIYRLVFARAGSLAADEEAARRNLWPEIDELLGRVRVIDPACGAGSFLAGMFRQLVDLQRRADGRLKRVCSAEERGRRILLNSLHGADVSGTACEAARLRLWLMLCSDGGRLNRPPAGLNIHRRDSLVAESKERFDIVIGNPPYVRKERIACPMGVHEDYKAALRQRAAACFPEFFAGHQLSGHCDLYIHFFFAGASLLKSPGTLCYITSNSWLDAAYGATLRRFLSLNTRLKLVLDNPLHRSFASATVNTAITLLSGNTAQADAAAAATRFVSLYVPLSRAKSPSLFCGIERAAAPVSTKTYRVLPVRQKAMDSAKWGGQFLRAPDIYQTILQKRARRLVSLDELADIQGYIHDNNTGPRFPAAPFIKTVRFAQSIRLASDSPGVVRFGVNPAGNSTRPAPILFPRTFGQRHLVLWNPQNILGKEFYKIIPRDSIDPACIAAQLNSTLAILQRELLGLVNLGDGAIKFSIADLRLFRLLPSLPASAMGHFERLASRGQLDFPEELDQPDRLALDEAVFDGIGLSRRERAAVYSGVMGLLNARATRARSVR